MRRQNLRRRPEPVQNPQRRIRAPSPSTGRSRYLVKYTWADSSHTEGESATWFWNESANETEEEGDGEVGRLQWS